MSASGPGTADDRRGTRRAGANPSSPTACRWQRRSAAVGRQREAAVVEGAERVHLVDAGVEVASLLAPGQCLGRRDAAEHLEDAALVDAVLGPGAGEVLDARHLDPGNVA